MKRELYKERNKRKENQIAFWCFLAALGKNGRYKILNFSFSRR